VLTVMNPATVPESAKARDQFVDGRVEGGRLINGGGFGSHSRTTGPQRHLDAGSTVMLAWIALVADFHLDPVDLLSLVVLVDPLKFLDDVFTEPIGDFAVPTLDDNFHLASHG